ncbi:MAG: response regulator [Leptolyngbya sp. SIO3F4]|nr:response regulator [Leptolyngbya sp. SIO3F4]
MDNLLQAILSFNACSPQQYCSQWQTPIVGLHMASSLVIALAYFSIPITLYFTYKGDRILTSRLFWLLGIFITLCGISYSIDVWAVWYPADGLAVIIRLLTALIAVCIAVELIVRLPELLILKTPSELAAVNKKLKTEIYRRRDAQTAFYGLVSSTSMSTGSDYFSTLVVSLAMILNVQNVVVAERLNLDSLEMQTLAMWHGDDFQDSIIFSAVDTPCAQAIETGKAQYCTTSLDLPSGHPLEALKATTYLSAPLLDDAENVLGTLCILHTGPLEDPELAKSFLQVFAARSAAELKRHQAEQALVTAYDDLESRIQQRTAELAKAKETAELANRAKSTFLAKISHELRTPLNAILGFTQLMSEDSELSSDHNQALDIIDASGSHLLALINNILEFTKLENGHVNLQPSAVDIKTLLCQAGDMMQLKAQEQELLLRIDCDRSIPHHCYIDGSKLRQIVLNMLENAIKYTSKGEVCLKAYVIDQDNAPQLGLEISDTGQGISPNEQRRIFNPFYQSYLSTAHDASEQGVGLGLAICQGLIKLMDGSIRCHSQLDKGTTFYIQLPMTVIQQSPQLDSPLRGEPQYLNLSKQDYEILVVEDAPTNRLLLKNILGNAGFKIREAENGQEAIEQWTVSRPDLVLMDIQMPIMNGYDATAYIKQQDPFLPIIALTASTFDTQLEEILSVGCDACIYKPFKREYLLQIVNKHLMLASETKTSAASKLKIRVETVSGE